MRRSAGKGSLGGLGLQKLLLRLYPGLFLRACCRGANNRRQVNDHAGGDPTEHTLISSLSLNLLDQAGHSLEGGPARRVLPRVLSCWIGRLLQEQLDREFAVLLRDHGLVPRVLAQNRLLQVLSVRGARVDRCARVGGADRALATLDRNDLAEQLFILFADFFRSHYTRIDQSN